MSELVKFLKNNYGVLVTTDAAGNFACQCCGAQGVFASIIQHEPTCVYTTMEQDDDTSDADHHR
jgi:hypothetical protein